MNTRAMFGGAITMDLPPDLMDASNLRQVPDNQEVFLSPDSDASFVLEILERVEANDGEDAIKFHFDSLAHDNSARSQSILSITLPHELQSPPPPATPQPTILVGEQGVRKFNRLTIDRVRIFMALYRIEAKGVDIVLTANIPGEVVEDEQPDQERSFVVAAASLKIVDFGLFV